MSQMPYPGHPTGQEFLGIDVGATKTYGVRIDTAGLVLAGARRPTRAGTSQALLAGILATVGELTTPAVAGIGVGLPGLVQAGTGVLLYAPTFPFGPVPVAESLGSATGLPVVCDNDANAAAWAEYLVGAAAGHRHSALVTVGTGLGCGAVVDGRLLRGANGLATEVSHLLVAQGGEPCGCGVRGCLGIEATGYAIAVRARRTGRDPAAWCAAAGCPPTATTGDPGTPDHTAGKPADPDRTTGIPADPDRTAGKPNHTAGKPADPDRTTGDPAGQDRTAGKPNHTAGIPANPDRTAGKPDRTTGDPAGGCPTVTGELVTMAALRGDPVAIGILRETGDLLGRGLAALGNLLDPEILVVGGGASEAGELLLGPARASFRNGLYAAGRRPEIPVVIARLGGGAGAVGAGLLAAGAAFDDRQGSAHPGRGHVG